MIRDGSPYPKYFIASYLDYSETVSKLYKVYEGNDNTHRLTLINWLLKTKKKCTILFLEDITEDVGYNDSKYEFEVVRGE